MWSHTRHTRSHGRFSRWRLNARAMDFVGREPPPPRRTRPHLSGAPCERWESVCPPKSPTDVYPHPYRISYGSSSATNPRPSLAFHLGICIPFCFSFPIVINKTLRSSFRWFSPPPFTYPAGSWSRSQTNHITRITLHPVSHITRYVNRESLKVCHKLFTGFIRLEIRTFINKLRHYRRIYNYMHVFCGRMNDSLFYSSAPYSRVLCYYIIKECLWNANKKPDADPTG